jgi:hypothetical protein
MALLQFSVRQEPDPPNDAAILHRNSWSVKDSCRHMPDVIAFHLMLPAWLCRLNGKD